MRRSSRRTLLLSLGLPALLVVVQQQLLQRQPPRLEQLQQAPASSGPAALQVRFSRPMAATDVAKDSRLAPPLRHRWLGKGSGLLLTLEDGQRIEGPLDLWLAGADPRGLALRPSRWRWDPRPMVLAVVRVRGGEQLQLRGHNGRWQPISPIWRAIPVMLPLGDGSAVAVASQLADGRLRLWLIPLRQDNPRRAEERRSPLAVGRPMALAAKPVAFSHFSSNRRGDLLVQSGRLEADGSSTMVRGTDGRTHTLTIQAGGPIRLAPEGGAMLIPEPEGLSLQTLPPSLGGSEPPRRQILPGSRDLSSFCPQSGRALLLRHWPDYRRSLELVEPGQAPRQLWLGGEALLASACSRGGQRVWALLLEGIARPRLSVASFDATGRLLERRSLPDWEAEPGAGLHWDPSTGQLLTVLRPLATVDSRQPAQAVLIDGEQLSVQPLGLPVSQAQWLPGG
jgi:hypothetical protein